MAATDELLGDDAFVEGVAGIEQERQFAVLSDLQADFGDVAQLLLIGHRTDRALVGLVHTEGYSATIRENRALPAPRSKCRNRGKG
jgi:hypothetical protein